MNESKSQNLDESQNSYLNETNKEMENLINNYEENLEEKEVPEERDKISKRLTTNEINDIL